MRKEREKDFVSFCLSFTKEEKQKSKLVEFIIQATGAAEEDDDGRCLAPSSLEFVISFKRYVCADAHLKNDSIPASNETKLN